MENNLKSLLTNNVLFVPVFSARSYETGVYNLAVDGNMARIISKIIEVMPKQAIVLIPENSENLEVWERYLANNNVGLDSVTFIRSKAYGKNARETRYELNAFHEEIYKLLKSEIPIDTIVMEPNCATLYIDQLLELANQNPNIVYWCVASETSNGTPWFVEEFSLIDKKIAEKFETICALPSQVEYLQGKSYTDTFYCPFYFDYKTIFFPFRLTDKNYQAELVRDAISEIRKEFSTFDLPPFKVLYTDVNDSGIFTDDEIFCKVPSQKEVYLSILKSKPIIPYLENSDVLMHINILEFLHYGCKVLMKENHTFSPKDYPSIRIIKDGIKQSIIDALLEKE